VQLCHNFIS
jgi:hypothetical protein